MFQGSYPSKGENNPGTELLIGAVSTFYPQTNTAEIVIEDQSVPALYVGGLFSGFLGLRDYKFLETGTKVLCLFARDMDTYFIIGTFPNSETVADSFKGIYSGASKIQFDDSDYETLRKALDNSASQYYADNFRPANTGPGELDLQNAYGVGLKLLRYVAKLGAGDRAKIETFLIDDLVRIVSGNYEHLSAFGEFKILNDGPKADVIWHGTSETHEARNLEEPTGEEEGSLSGEGNVDLDSVESFEETLRSRFRMYVGSLGSFINMFVMDPVDSIAKIAETDQLAGKFCFHVNHDGSMLVQSVSELALEKVVRVVVPKQKKEGADPSGNVLAEEYESLSKDFYARWDETSGNLWETAYKLRDYSRWFSRVYALAEFKTREDDWEVPSEQETKKPDAHDKLAFKTDVNSSYKNHDKYIERYATIRIFKDGSILNQDAYGSTIHMSRGDINFSPSNNLHFTVPGAVNFLCGSFNLHAKSNIDIAATDEKNGKLTLRGKKYAGMLSDERLTLESKGNKEDSLILYSKDGGMHLESGQNITIVSKLYTMFKNVRTIFDSSYGVLMLNIADFLRGGVVKIKSMLWTTNLMAQDVFTGRKLEVALFKQTNLVIHNDKHENPEIESTFKEANIPEINPSNMFKHPSKSHFRLNEYETLGQQNIRLEEDTLKKAIKIGNLEYEDFDPAGKGDDETNHPFPGEKAKHKEYEAEETKLAEPASKKDFTLGGGSFKSKDLKIKTIKK